MRKQSDQKTSYGKQHRLALVIVVSIGFVLNIIGDEASQGMQFEPQKLLLGAGLTLLYLILGYFDDPILDNLPFKWAVMLYPTVQTALIFGIGWVLGVTGTWLIALPMVGWAVENLSSVWRWPVIGAIGLALVLPPGLRHADWSTTIYAVPAFSAAILFVIVFTQMRLNEQKSRMQAESLSQQLEEKNQQLAAYAAQVKDLATTEERNRLARELHDSVTQSLYSLTLLSAGWRRLARDGKLEDVADSFAEIEEVAQQALKEMRLLIYQLRPPALENEGLQGALHHRLSAVEKRAGVEARLVTDELSDLPPAVEEALYAIALEALNNALKHASATNVTVKLLAGDGRIRLEVMDDGRGFDPLRGKESRGMGLKSMRERVEQLNGKLEITSKPGAGTNVGVEVAV